MKTEKWKCLNCGKMYVPGMICFCSQKCVDEFSNAHGIHTPKKSFWYKCRFCQQPFEQITEEPKYIFKKNICVGMIMVYTCKRCGVVMIENMINYTPEQYKEMFKK